MKIHYVACKNCGWVHFRVKRKDAELKVKQFQRYFDSLTQKQKDEYYGGKYEGIKTYMHCGLCNGPWENFRPATKAELAKINGCTIGPILDFREAK